MSTGNNECEHPGVNNTTNKCMICGENWDTVEMQRKVEGSTLEHRKHNVGESNYADHKIQPWDIWKEYKLNPWDADIVKRTLRTKKGNSRVMDYRKIIHICEERIHQIEEEGL